MIKPIHESEKILADHSGIPVEDIIFNDENQCIRPSEALAAMEEYADLRKCQQLATHQFTEEDMHWYAEYCRNGLTNAEYSVKDQKEHLWDWRKLRYAKSK